MADDAHALDAEQRRAAVLGVVELLECRHDLALLHASLDQQPHHERRDRLVELEHDVADEAVTDDDVEVAGVAAAGGQVPALDVADEVEAGRLQHRVGFLGDRVALLGFLADAQQAAARHQAEAQTLQGLVARLTPAGAPAPARPARKKAGKADG